MKQLLNQVLKFRGIESYTELTGEEKAEFDRWQEVFEKEVSLETVTGFIESQLPHLRKELVNSVKNSEDRKSFIVSAKIENYESILAIIRETDLAKERLEADLEALIKNNG